MPFVRVTILTRGKRCSASIMTAGFLSMNTTQSAFTNGQSIATETRRLERHMDISAQAVTVSELLSLFDVLRLSAYAIGFSEWFYRLTTKATSQPQGTKFERGKYYGIHKNQTEQRKLY